MQGWGFPWFRAAAGAVGVVLLVSGVGLLRAWRKLPEEARDSKIERAKPPGRQSRIVFAIEVTAIGIGTAICDATGHPELVVPVVALIVGVHFFPLASLFHVQSYYVTGSLLCVLVIVTLLVMPANATFEGRQILTWWPVVAFGSALILWGTSIEMWLAAQRLLTQERAS